MRNLISINDGNGVDIRDQGSTNNVVEGNYIGVDATGTQNLGNLSDGVAILSASGNTIGGTAPGAGNLISGNNLAGILLQPNTTTPNIGSTGNLIEGNLIGTQPGGNRANGNFGDGILIFASPGNTVGGTTPAVRNVISGNRGFGITIMGEQATLNVVQGTEQATLNVVQGNYIGTNASGSRVDASGSFLPFLSNLQGGIQIQNAPGNLVGGTVDGARNVISGNQGAGVLITGMGSANNQVEGDVIGPDASGLIAIGNSGSGVVLDMFASGNTIGGTDPGARNIISSSLASGITLQRQAIQNVIQGNFIGPDITGTHLPLLGTQPLGNLQNGITFLEFADENTIGGTAPGAGNVIAGNTGNGLDFSSESTGNLVLGNKIGVDVSGAVRLGNALNGVFINDVSGNTIGGTAPGAGNVVAGNALNGIEIAAGTGTTERLDGSTVQGNLLLGNKIGTDASGNSGIGNAQNGVFLDASPANTIGGTVAGAGNLIAANGLSGVALIGSSSSGNLLLGNKIGTNTTGLLALGNALDGVLLTDASSNSLGGTASGAGNLISGNGGNGIDIKSSAGNVATGNVIQGNTIGTDATGTSVLSNADDGVSISASVDNLVGGTTPGALNLISGNGQDGILVAQLAAIPPGASMPLNVIQGNRIGTSRDGEAALGNLVDGVAIDAAIATLVGGTTPGR